MPSVYNELVSEDAKFQQPITGENDELNSDMESKPTGRKGSLTRSKTESRKINKGTKRETAPRFQNMTKGKGMPNPRMVNGDGAQQKKKVSATAEDVAVLGFRTVSLLNFKGGSYQWVMMDFVTFGYEQICLVGFACCILSAYNAIFLAGGYDEEQIIRSNLVN